MLHTMAEYDNCTKDLGTVLNTSDPGAIVTLEKNGSFYFICTVDNHCKSGQKFFINVLTPNSTGAETPSPSPSSAASLTIGACVAALSTIVISFLIYI